MHKSIYLLIVAFFVISGITSNSIYSIPIKSIVFFFLLIVLAYGIYKRKYKFGLYEIGLVYLSFILLIVWGTIGYLNGYYTSLFQQAGKILAVVFSWLVFYLFIHNRTIDIHLFRRAISIGFWSSICVKIFFELNYILGIMSSDDIVDLYQSAFHLEVMPLAIADGAFLRIGTIIDVFVLSVFPFLVYTAHNRKYKILIYISVIIFTFINFSRAYMVQTVILMGAMLLPNEYKGVRISLVQNTFLFSVLGIVLFVGIGSEITNSSFATSITERFVGVNAEASDFERVIQYNALVSGIDDNILFGHGLGSYISNYIRSDDMPFLYELEYLALLYQFGVLGLMYIIGIFAYMIKEIKVSYLPNNIKIVICLNVLLFFIRPLMNPMLFASSSILTLISMLVYSVYIHDHDQIRTNN